MNIAPMYSVPRGTARLDNHGLLISLTHLLRPVSVLCFTLHYIPLHTYMRLSALYLSPRRTNASSWPSLSAQSFSRLPA
jgi:hypothetical protein